MQVKNIDTIFVELTAQQKAKVPASLVYKTKNNRDVMLIRDLKSCCSSLAGETLKYVDYLASQFNTAPTPDLLLPEDPNISTIYHVVPAAWVTSNQNSADGTNRLNAVKTIDGRWVVSFNTLYEFWDFFSNGSGISIPCVQLSYSDFPVTPRH